MSDDRRITLNFINLFPWKNVRYTVTDRQRKERGNAKVTLFEKLTVHFDCSVASRSAVIHDYNDVEMFLKCGALLLNNNLQVTVLLHFSFVEFCLHLYFHCKKELLLHVLQALKDKRVFLK